MNRFSRLSIPVILMSCIEASVAQQYAHGGAFAIDEQGVAAMGRANAFAGQADNPTALFYNPAGIGQLSDTQLSVGTTVIMPTYSFQSDVTARETDTVDAIFYPVTLYITHELREDLHIGLGILMPIGLSTEWPGDWEGRYATTFSEINTIYINPNIAWSPTRTLHLAAGFSYVPSSVQLKNKLELTPSPDGETDINADGSGVGYNLAALASLPHDTAVGLSFRSAVAIDYDGHATLAALGITDDVRSSLTLPPMLTVGISNRSLRKLTLNLDWQWVGWSSIDRILLDFASLPDEEIPKNWTNSSSVRFGVEGAFENLSLRAGYAYDLSPVPSETLDPSLPDADKQTVAIGGGYRMGSASIDLAYMLVMAKDRSAANTLPTGGGTGTPFDHRGTYSSKIHEVGVGITYQFD